MIKQSHLLYELIHSMTRSEKGYFKRVANLSGKKDTNVYLQLFDAIQRQKEYDEKAIKNSFKSQRFVKQLSVAKNYLFNQVLKSLEFYHTGSGKNPLLTIRSRLNRLNILVDRNLFHHAEKLIIRLREDCIGLEMYMEALEVINLEKKIYQKILPAEQFHEKYDELYDLELDYLEKYRNIQEYRNLTRKFYYLYVQQGNMHNKEQQKQYKEIINTPLFKDESNIKCPTAKCYLFNLKTLHYYLIEDHKTLYLYSSQLLELLENHAYINVLQKTSSLLSCIYNHLTSCLLLGKFEEFKEGLDKLLSIKAENNIESSRITYLYYNMKINWKLEIGDFDVAYKEILDFDAILSDGQLTNVDDLTKGLFYWQAAYTCLIRANFSDAHTWINKYYEIDSQKQRADVDTCMRIHELVVYFELGHTELLLHKVKAMQRYLSKASFYSKVEEAFIRFFRDINKTLPGTDTNQKFKELYEEISNIDQNQPPSQKQFNDSLLDIFDLLTWLESKIENQPFAALLRKKRTEKYKAMAL